MSKNNKTFNLKEGSFPIQMDLKINDIHLKDIGEIKDSVSSNIKISLISKDLYKLEGSVKAIFNDKCQSCLNDIEVKINFLSNVVIKDKNLMIEDDSGQDQTHYQNLEFFDIQQLIEEELSLNYPNIVKCEEQCIEIEQIKIKEKNLPFKKIRDLMD